MNKWIVALTVIIPTLIEVIDTAVVNVSLDHIRGSLSAGVDEATWAITSYLVSNAIVIPLTGWLARYFGRKKYLMFSIALFTVSSFFCGCAWSLSSLIFFRVLQGLGGGALQPISLAILLETFPVSEHGIAGAIFGVGVMFAPIIGPILGGWITDNWSWHWIFYINIPIGILSLMAVAMVIKDPPYLQNIRKNIDYWGIGFIAIGLGTLQVVLDKGQQEDWFSSAFIVKLAVISAIALVSFVAWELRAKEPVVNLRIFKNIGFTAGNLIQFFAFGVMFGSIVLLPIYLQKFMGYTAFLAGLALAPGGVATLLTMPIAGKMISRTNPKILLVGGMLIASYSTLLLTQLTAYVSIEFIFWARILMGMGLAFVFIALTNMTLSQIRKEEMGNATAIFNLFRNLGGSFGVAFVTTMIARRGQFHQMRLAEHLSAFDLKYQTAINKIVHFPQAMGSVKVGQGVVYQGLLKQSSIFAFNDVFMLCTMILLSIIPLAFFLRWVRTPAATAAVH